MKDMKNWDVAVAIALLCICVGVLAWGFLEQ